MNTCKKDCSRVQFTILQPQIRLEECYWEFLTPPLGKVVDIERCYIIVYGFLVDTIDIYNHTPPHTKPKTILGKDGCPDRYELDQ